MNYTREYFINKFEAIPDELWCVGAFTDGAGRHCAYGHCGAKRYSEHTIEGISLRFLLSANVARINDNLHGQYSHLGSTPKERILNALKELK